MDVLPHDGFSIFSLKRHLSGTEFIEDDTKGVNVTTLIARKTKCLLW